MIQKKGNSVRPISVQNIVETSQNRKLLECFTFERAAQVIRLEEMASLKELLTVEGKQKAGNSEVIAINNVLHLSLGRLARNHRVFDELQLALGVDVPPRCSLDTARCRVDCARSDSHRH